MMMRITRFTLTLYLCMFSVCAVANLANMEEVEALLAEKEFDNAITALDKLIREQPQQAHYLFLRARALADSGQIDAAIHAYTSLIKLHPGLPEPYNNLAFLHARRGELQRAESLLNQAMQTDATFSTVYNNLTALNAVKARKAYARALNIPVGSDALKIKSVEKLTLAQVEKPLQHEKQGVKTLKTDANPTLVYQGAADKADKKNRPAPAKMDLKTVQAGATDFLQAWARVWAAQDVDAYLGFYHTEYAPRGMQRADWVKLRRQRIKRPRRIEVRLSNFAFRSREKGKLQVRVDQLYKTSRYTDLTRKEFILQKENGQWLIIKERGLGFIKR